MTATPVLVSSALLGKVIFPLLARYWAQDRAAFRQLAGQTAAERVGDPLPAATVASITAHQVALKGPLGNTPSFRNAIERALANGDSRARVLAELGLDRPQA